jgi:hypothetical protein
MTDRTPDRYSGQAQRDPESMVETAPSLQMDTGLRRYDERRGRYDGVSYSRTASHSNAANCYPGQQDRHPGQQDRHPGLDPGSMSAANAVVERLSGYRGDFFAGQAMGPGMTVLSFGSVN